MILSERIKKYDDDMLVRTLELEPLQEELKVVEKIFDEEKKRYDEQAIL